MVAVLIGRDLLAAIATTAKTKSISGAVRLDPNLMSRLSASPLGSPLS